MAGKTKKDIRTLHGAMVDLFAMMNRPQRDDTVLREAGLSLDRALYPLLVGVGRFGPVGVVDLAERVGRDYTTVSRQVTKLQKLKLIERQSSTADRRINEAVVTSQGLCVIEALDAARERIAAPILKGWSDEDFGNLVRLMRRFVDDLIALPENAIETSQKVPDEKHA